MLTLDPDMLFIGPTDLAASMGYFGPDHAKIPEVQEATARILRATKEAGKFAGHFALNATTGKSECYYPGNATLSTKTYFW
jgi:4-hydroxy-2-oxoheptanedioate aldolase